MGKDKKKKRKPGEKATGVWAEFKTFISKGSVLDMAVGVIMASAFSAIVTALTNILLSVVTWGLPGGINGLVTVLPAANSLQAGVAGIGQKFDAGDLLEMTYKFGEAKGYDQEYIEANLIQVQNLLLGSYTNYGGTYIYNSAAIINWGSFINAIISFLFIALCLFIILKVVNSTKKMNEKMKADALEKYYQEHPEERPTPEAPAPVPPTEAELLTQIRDLLAAQAAPAEKAKAKKE